MEGSVELETGVAACVHAGGVRGRCREETWAWSKPGWRRVLISPGTFTVCFIQFTDFRLGSAQTSAICTLP